MKKLLLVVGFAVCMAGIARAELLDNGDFEAGTDFWWHGGSGSGTGTAGYAWKNCDGRLVASGGSDGGQYFHLDTTPMDGHMDNWGWAWSGVGTIGRPLVWSGDELTIDFYAKDLLGGGAELGIYLEWEDASGTRVDYDGDGAYDNQKDRSVILVNLVGDGTWEHFNLTYTVPTVDLLGNPFSSPVAQAQFMWSAESGLWSIGVDELSIVPDKAHKPQPGDGDQVSTSLDILEWENPDPNDPADPITCVVYYSTDYPEAGLYEGDPNFTDYAVSIPVNGDNISAAIPDALVLDRTYYWRVDCTDPATGQTVIGHVWEFSTVNGAPVVDAGADVFTWLVEGSRVINIDATVTDDGFPDPPAAYGVTWAVTGGDAGNIAITETDPVAEDAEVTVTAVGTYELTLTADDSDKEASDTVTINVLEDACEAAKAAGVEVLVGDFNEDCVVDMGDAMVMAGDWLSCISLDCM